MRKLIFTLLMAVIAVASFGQTGTVTSVSIRAGIDTTFTTAVTTLSTVIKPYIKPVPVLAVPVISYPAVSLSGVVGSAIASDSPINNGGAVDKWLVSPELPGGISIDVSGVISGIPLVAATTAQYTVTATNNSGSSKFVISMVIAAKPVVSTNPGGALSKSVVYSNRSNFNITNLEFNGGATDQVVLNSCSNVHIYNVKFGNGNIYGLVLNNCTNITVDGNYFYKLAKFVMVKGGSGIKVNNNQMLNLYEPVVYNGDFAHAVQFNGVSGGGNQINNNRIENIYGVAVHPHDIINVYNSNGLKGDSIQVIGNYIRGGMVDGGWPNAGDTGAGITVGDEGGSYQVVRGNRLDAPGCAAIQVNGVNSSIRIEGNWAVSTIKSKVAADAFIGLQGKTNVSFVNNRANWVKYNGATGASYAGGEVLFWFGTTGTVSGVTLIGNAFDTSLTSANVMPKVIITYN